MAKRPIPNLPLISYPEMEYDDLLVVINANRTRKVKLSDLFSAGCIHSDVNTFTANTQIGYSTDPQYSTLAVTVASNSSNRKIVFGGSPEEATDDNLVSSFGDIYVNDPFVFRTSSSDSSLWSDAARKMSLLNGTTSTILYTDPAGDVKPVRLANSPTIRPTYNSENSELAFSVISGTEQEGNLSLNNFWITNDDSFTAANTGVILSILDTIAICPYDHNRHIQAIGLVEEGTTHVANCAASIWGNVYIDGAIKSGNTEGTIEGLGFGTMSLFDANNVVISGGTVQGVSIYADEFQSAGIEDNASDVTLTISSTNKVGIGVPVASEKLHVDGTTLSTVFKTKNEVGIGCTIDIDEDNASAITLKSPETTNLGIKLVSTTTTNSIHYGEGLPLKFFNSGIERLKLSQEGHLSLGSPSTSEVIFSCKGSEEASDSSISLVNVKSVGDSYSNIYFGGLTEGGVAYETKNWIKFQHLANGESVDRMKFGILNTEKMRINSDSTIEFKNSSEVTKMVWDGDDAELRIEGTKVWHEGNDGDGSGCDADLLDGQHGDWHRTWYNLINKPTLVLTGDVTGSVAFSIGPAESTLSVTTTVGDNTHRHDSSTIDGLSSVVNGSITASTILTLLKTVDGPGSGVDADTCDGQHLGTSASPTFNNLTITGTINETSDRRFKENIEPLTNAIDVINKLNGVSFNKIDTPDKVEHGFIAQEVEAIVPEVVETDDEGYKSINYSRLTALLVEAVKELSKKIDNR